MKDRSEYFARYRAANKERYARWRAEHREYQREYNRRYQLENKEKLKQQKKAYRSRPEIAQRIRDKVRKWRRANPEWKRRLAREYAARKCADLRSNYVIDKLMRGLISANRSDMPAALIEAKAAHLNFYRIVRRFADG